MARILVSFLGTGLKTREYRRSKYKIDDSYYETSFVSAALTQHLKVDRKIILGTSKSMWEEYYRYFSEQEGAFDENFYYEIADAIEKSTFIEGSDVFSRMSKELEEVSILLLDYGLNEKELRNNINKVLEIENYIDEGDEVYMDVTHGFRSFPLLAQQAINYLKLISSKNIEVKGYYYGMLEAINELGYAPIVDMSILNSLNDLIIGAYDFKHNSNGEAISALLVDKAPEVSKKINNFSKAVSINYSHEIRSQIQQLSKLDLAEVPLPERHIVEKVLDDFLQRFSNIKDASAFQLRLAEWYMQNKYYGASYIFLTESIITKVVEDSLDSESTENNVFEKSLREKAKKNIYKYNKDLTKIYNSVNKVRKNIAHALDSRHNTYLNDITGLEKNVAKVKRIFGVK